MNLKHNCLFVVLILLSCVKTAGSVKNNSKFTFKIKQDFTETVFPQFRKYDLSLLFKIVEAEPVRVYNNTLRPEKSMFGDREKRSYGETTNLVCSHYYGMDIPKAWSSGYTGKGVIFGITDVGINTDLLDLKQNTIEDLCHNFINNSKDVAPDVLHNMRSESNHATDHGNRVASIVAATKGNNLCSAGIAHDTKFAALKIYQVISFEGIVELHPKHWTESDITSKALTHRLDKIDIFVNAWTSTNTFDPLDLGTRESLAYGAGSGRNGLGAIYTFPAGPVGNGLSNTNNTITVNSIGIQGIIPDDAQIDASVLTSGLWQGNNLTASDMVTTTRNDRCITSFKGVSAAVAQVSAIIGLGLEAKRSSVPSTR
ncbi:neuroendocrine convertase 2-like isoform X2 [Mercenaria mercenaria]|uniref:neuroendocrine convertase 2-like isoform X2 n=1 Tax=Mercenaria mercenaria TaxID=6596 RepID=UPI00234E834A|nr:neuroendocrine convertase 2-like isoform X2 [Mercenaria mercenaria]